MYPGSSRFTQVYQRMVEWFHSHPPDHAIRGATIGVFAAFTPTIGIQIPIIIGFRLLLSRYWEFSLPVAISCTFITNVFTFAPIYYLFVVTGRVMLGRWGEVGGFDVFSAKLRSVTQGDAGLFEGMWHSLVGILEIFGLPLFVGCLPWATGLALLTYITASRIARNRTPD